MTWKVQDIVSQRKEFVMLALGADSNIRQLCRHYAISPRTAYKWIERYRLAGSEGLRDLARRPRSSPGQTDGEIERMVLEVRDSHPAWGGRKIRHYLLNHGQCGVPAASTMTGILRRHGRIDPLESAKHTAFMRFEHPRPNDLWQMDFKGHFAVGEGGRCHPLTVLDDHSRYAVGLRACGNETTLTVRSALIDLFRLHGLPARMLMDNGSPWGNDARHPWTPLTVWLTRMGIDVSHGRPYHPQTQGKDERFNRTLKAEVLRYESFARLADAQRRFDAWRETYNFERPHEALGMQPPASRYRPSNRLYPEALPAIEYDAVDQVRIVQDEGWLSYGGRPWRISKAFRGERVAIRPTPERDGMLDVYYCRKRVARLDLQTGETTRGFESIEAHGVSDYEQ